MDYKIGHIGALGEEIVTQYLKDKGFLIIERNYNVERIGEIDIIATKNDILHFIEVKTSINTHVYDEKHSVKHFDDRKKVRIIRSMEKYCFTRNITNYVRCVDLASVSVSRETSSASIAYYSNVFMSTV